MQEFRLKIANMTCVNCSNAIEKTCLKIEGVEKASVSYTHSSGVFLITKAELKERIKAKIKALGYEILSSDEDIQKHKEKDLKRIKNDLILSVLISALSMFLMMSYHGNLSAYLQLFLALIGIFYCGRSFFIHAFKGILNFNLDMNTLVSLGTLSAFVYSFLAFLGFFQTHLYFSEASMIITFVLLGKFLEERAKFKAFAYQEQLSKSYIQKARLVKADDEFEEINASFIKAGDIVLVKEGESVSVDGIVLEGKAEVDISSINGEFMPIMKQEKDHIEAGSVLINGVLKIKATCKAMDSKFELIRDLIFKASEKKMPIALLVDKVSAYFVGMILLIALLVFVFYAFNADFNQAFLRASAVLLISCPCALGLATPIALILAMMNASKHNILIKNPSAIECLRKIQYMFFDKTGTLSEERLSIYAHNLNEKDFQMLAQIQSFSSHPIAKAIASGVSSTNLSSYPQIIIAQGLVYKQDEHIFLAGNEKLLLDNEVIISKQIKDFVKQHQEKAPVLVYFAKDKHCLGVVCLQNKIRKEAFDLVSFLNFKGVKSVILSGDNEKSVSLVAKKLQIKDFKAHLSPQDKLNTLKEYQQNALCAFVGDGVNDAAALRLANVSFVMNAGANLAKENGDFILMKNDLTSIAYAYKLSKKTFSIIKLNLFWASIYNILCIPIAAGVFPFIVLSPHLAALAMCFSSFCVVLNSLRLRKDILV